MHWTVWMLGRLERRNPVDLVVASAAFECPILGLEGVHP
jgi:hypothetical protein